MESTVLLTIQRLIVVVFCGFMRFVSDNGFACRHTTRPSVN